jgi:hypothetical protein
VLEAIERQDAAILKRMATLKPGEGIDPNGSVCQIGARGFPTTANAEDTREHRWNPYTKQPEPIEKIEPLPDE